MRRLALAQIVDHTSATNRTAHLQSVMFMMTSMASQLQPLYEHLADCPTVMAVDAALYSEIFRLQSNFLIFLSHVAALGQVEKTHCPDIVGGTECQEGYGHIHERRTGMGTLHCAVSK